MTVVAIYAVRLARISMLLSHPHETLFEQLKLARDAAFLLGRRHVGYVHSNHLLDVGIQLSEVHVQVVQHAI